jgi:DNA-binding CsgD family transcriptional regulator
VSGVGSGIGTDPDNSVIIRQDLGQDVADRFRRGNVTGFTEETPMSNELFGLDERAELVYSTALAHHTADPEALCSWLRWPVEQVRYAMETLIDRGLCVVAADGPMMLSPETAAERRNARAEREAEQLRATMGDEAAAIRSGLLGRYASGRLRPTTTSGVDLLTSFVDIGRVMTDLNRRSRRKVDFLAPRPEEKSFREALIVDPELAERRVRMRGVWFEREFADRPPPPEIRTLAATDGVRTVDGFPVKAIVWDGRVAMLPRDPADPTGAALLIVQPGLVAIVADLIGRHWDRGKSWTEPPPPTALTTRHRTILGLLTDGLTDEAIARRLGIGERTVRRDVAQMCDVLEVTGRVALGAEAVRRKLVT